MNSDKFFQEQKIIKKPKINENKMQSRDIQGYQYCNSYYEKINFQIQCNQGDCIKYIKDGQILLIDWITDDFSDDSIINNLDFLRYLLWDGQSNKKQKIGRWAPYWQGNKLDAGGYYNNEGQKIGKWVEPYNIFGETDLVYYVGYYQQGKRVGNWEYFQYYYHYEKNKLILHFRGGGQYNDFGIKQGKWIEVIEGFTDESEILSYGEYKNGREVGVWDTFFNKKLLFSGSYDMNGKKNGQWQDLHQYFYRKFTVYYTGNYKDDVKFGNWGMNFPDYNFFIEEQKDVKTNFGGLYDKNGIKNGRWIEFHDQFSKCPLIYIGEYKKGLKVGKWEIVDENNHVIGNGSFDNNSNKVGDWREVYYAEVSILYEGEYRNGKRFGNWNILEDNEIIGGGGYDDNGMKQGEWTEFHEYFKDNCNIICEGQYLNNKRIGKWEHYCSILFGMYSKVINIGCGDYDENGLKNGHWIDLSEDFWILHQIIFCGTYKNGFRIGTWEIHQYKTSKQEFNKKGGGNYDENGRKHGTWIDVSIDIYKKDLIFIKGEYINGKKNGEYIKIT